MVMVMVKKTKKASSTANAEEISFGSVDDDRVYEAENPRIPALHHSPFSSEMRTTMTMTTTTTMKQKKDANQDLLHSNEESVNPDGNECIVLHNHHSQIMDKTINSEMTMKKKKKKKKGTKKITENINEEDAERANQTDQNRNVLAHRGQTISKGMTNLKKKKKKKKKKRKDMEINNEEEERGSEGENQWKQIHDHSQVYKGMNKNTWLRNNEEQEEAEEEENDAENQWKHIHDYGQVNKRMKKTKKKKKKKQSAEKNVMINEKEENGGGGEEESVVGLLLSAFRRSGLTCNLPSPPQDQGVKMEIGWPTDVQHVTHVTFDRFNGFLGLPLELQTEIPRRVPSASASVFGVSAESMQCSYDRHGNSVPIILLLLQERLYDQGGLEAEGIFRINPENSKEEHVRDQLNKGNVPTNIDVHCLAGLIKAWLRELPTGVLDSLPPEELLQCNTEEQCLALVRLLPPTQAALLDWVVDLMADVVQKEQLNKMNARNVAMVFAPNMTQMSDPLTALMHAVQVMNFLKTLILKTLQDRHCSTKDCKSIRQDSRVATYDKLNAKDEANDTVTTMETHVPSKVSLGRKENIEKENHCPIGLLEERLLRSFKQRNSVVDLVTDSHRLPLANVDAIF